MCIWLISIIITFSSNSVWLEFHFLFSSNKESNNYRQNWDEYIYDIKPRYHCNIKQNKYINSVIYWENSVSYDMKGEER